MSKKIGDTTKGRKFSAVKRAAAKLPRTVRNMGSWLRALNLPSKLSLGSLLVEEPEAYRVLLVKPEAYAQSIVRCREDDIVLYGPTQDEFEIVLHRPLRETVHHAFSLYRSNDVEDAEQKFEQFKGKVSALVNASRELANVHSVQKLCDVLRQYPSWTVAHVAAHLELVDCFTEPVILSCLNASEPITGRSPLQVAVEANNIRAVNVLVRAKASLEHLDNEENSVFHYAARSSKHIINALSSASTKCLNLRNLAGQTPLHIACLADKPECVKALIAIGADVNMTANSQSSTPTNSTTLTYVGEYLQDNDKKLHSEDMKYGGTPLHWSCSRQVITTLIDMGCQVDSLNFIGRSALHMMVLRDRLECVVALLSLGACVNLADEDGNTALHLAVRHSSPAVVQALIVFGADVNHKNENGATPRHCVTKDERGERILYILHAVGAPRCPPGMEGCTKGCCAEDSDYNGIPPPIPPRSENRQHLNDIVSLVGRVASEKKAMGGEPTKGGRLLCLDGGGIRGLVLVQLLLELEKEIKKPIIQCFDWIAGTSTGGVLALGLVSGKSLQECMYIYFRIKDYAFVGGRPYSSEALEHVLKGCLGEHTVMTDIKDPKILITGVMADRKPVTLHLFRNYESPNSLLSVETKSIFKEPPKPNEQLLWHAARATGAAPSYFRAFGQFLDGGLIANNPTLDALTEIHEYNVALATSGRAEEARPVSVVVSLGTGINPTSHLREIDVFRPESLWDTARLAIGISALGTLLVDQVTASDGRVVDRARAWCSMAGIPYFRFSPQLTHEVAMDERSDQVLVNMMWEAKAYMHENKARVNDLARLIAASEN